MAHLDLPDTIDRVAAQELIAVFQTAIAEAGPIIVNASAIERIGQAGLQLLLSARRTAAEAKLSFEIVEPSIAFMDAAKLTGLEVHVLSASAA